MRQRQFAITISSKIKNIILSKLKLKEESSEQEKKEYLKHYISKNLGVFLPEIELNEPPKVIPYIKFKSNAKAIKKILKSKIKISSNAKFVSLNNEVFEPINNPNTIIDLNEIYSELKEDELNDIEIDDILNINKKDLSDNTKKCKILLNCINNCKNDQFKNIEKYLSDCEGKIEDFELIRNYLINNFDKIKSICINKNGNTFLFDE